MQARRIGIDTQHEAVVFMRRDCHVCRSEGFLAHTRVQVSHGEKDVIATLYHTIDDLLAPGEIGLSEKAWRLLQLNEGQPVHVNHPRPLESFRNVRGKIYGKRFDKHALQQITEDVVSKRYSDIQLSSFITACSANALDNEEISFLTRAMVDAGDRLTWRAHTILDKHCVGGLPGNRTTPIVVAIVAACGLTIPKTSSRAITSPAGTADTMETLAPVDLDISTMRRVVEAEGGCIVWGGAVHLSPADDTLIRVERALDLDSEGQLVASVLSKKIAAGATHVALDLPVGPTAKVRDIQTAERLSRTLCEIAQIFGLKTKTILSDGVQPVGRGIGPALEARDVLSVLQNQDRAPADLRNRALSLAGSLLELGGAADEGEGIALAETVLSNGAAWQKFRRICEAQGGLREPPTAIHKYPVIASHAGIVSSIDNRRIARVAKLAGAPDAKAAGLELHMRLGQPVARGAPLYTIHAETGGELDYALQYLSENHDIIGLVEA